MKCLNNGVVSLTWWLIWSALWVVKKLFTARLAISAEWVRCDDMVESISHTFLCSVVRLLCKILDGYMVRVLNGKFFVQEISSVCSNVVPHLTRRNTLCFFVDSALWESWFGRSDWRNSTKASLPRLRHKWFFTSTKSKLKNPVWETKSFAKVGEWCMFASRKRHSPGILFENYRLRSIWGP